MVEKLVEKRSMYLEEKTKIEAYDYSKEIDEALAKYKANLVEQTEAQRAKNLAKVNTYLELLDDLIADCSEPTESTEMKEE